MNKVISAAQLALRAGKTAQGDRLIPAIQSGKAKCVLYSAAAGSNIKKKIQNKCSYYEIPAYQLPVLEFNSITTRALQALAITDAGFAHRIEEEIGKER